MRRARLAAAAIPTLSWILAGASLLRSSDAVADHFSIHATVVGTVAATDNVLNAQDGTPADGDIFVQVRPGALFVYETPRMIQELVGEVEALEFVRHNDQPSFSGHAASRAFYTPGPLSSFATVLDVSSGEVSALTSRTAPSDTGIALQPSTLVYTRNGTASETATKQVALGTSVHETGAAVYAFTTDNGTADPIRHQANQTLAETVSLFAGVTRSWPFDSLTFDLGLQFLHLERAAPLGSAPGSDTLQRELNPQATATWRHDFDKHWSGALSGGVVVVNPVGTDPFNPTVTTPLQFFPVATLQAAYTTDWGRAVVSIGRTVAPVLFIAQNTDNDTALAQLLVPITWGDEIKRGPPHLVASASLGVTRTSLIDSVMGMGLGAFDVVHSDVGVLWTPRPDTTYGARLEYFKQVSETDANSAEQFFNFSRTTLFFTMSVRWPARVVAQIPQQQSLRADGRDTAVPGEVVVPEEPSETSGGPDGGGSR